MDGERVAAARRHTATVSGRNCRRRDSPGGPEATPDVRSDMNLTELQDLVARLYTDRDSRRGIDGSLDALSGRIADLPELLTGGDIEKQARHLADALVELTSVANGLEINLQEAIRYYVHGCPECGNNPCDCN